MELNFSFKKTKEQQPEKYPNVAVLTYLGSNKFALNNSAVKLLEYSENKVTGRISFGATSTNKFFIANTSGEKLQINQIYTKITPLPMVNL